MAQKLTSEQVTRLVQDAIFKSGGLLRLARKLGMAASGLHYMAYGKRPPSEKVCEFLRIRRVEQTHYERVS